jgi:hypothetical protein
MRCAYIRVGYKSEYSSGGFLVAEPLTSPDESDKSDDELVDIGKRRLEAKIAEITEECPHYNIFQRNVRVGFITHNPKD